jgi:hypothetical protein
MGRKILGRKNLFKKPHMVLISDIFCGRSRFRIVFFSLNIYVIIGYTRSR